jgi:hypothetical protein
MNKEDFKNVEDMIKDIEDVSYEKIGYLKELISLEYTSHKNTDEFNKIISLYIGTTKKEKTLYGKLFKNKNYLSIADKIITNDIGKLNANIMSVQNDYNYILIRMFKIIDKTLDNMNSNKVDKLNNLITDLQMYELELSSLYYLDKIIKEGKTSIVLDKLIRNKYMLAFTSPSIEKFMIESNFTAPNILIKFTDYYIEKFNLPLSLYKSRQEEIFIDTLIDYIIYLDNISPFDMLNLEVKAEIHTRLAYIKGMSLDIPNDVINSIIYHQTYKNDLMRKIVISNLLQAMEEKEKTAKLIRVQE